MFAPTGGRRNPEPRGPAVPYCVVMRPSSVHRFLFSAPGAYGHVYPLLPLAFALRAAGHEIHFATSRDFVDRLRRAGFETSRVGITLAEAEAQIAARPDVRDAPREEKWRLGAFMFGNAFATKTAADLVELMPRLDVDLVVYDEYDLGAPLAARVHGVPSVAHALGRPPSDIFRTALAHELSAVWQHMSDEPFVDPFTADAYIDITPPALRGETTIEPARRIFQRSVATTDDDGTLPAWVTERRGRPLAYVTLGTVSFGAVDALQQVIAGLAELDVDVLVTVGPAGDVDALGPLPRSVRAVPFVPQDALLPYVDFAVHHCGSGTMLGMLAHGIPQVAIPQGADQFWNADALVASGAGLLLLPEEIAPATVTGAVRTLMADPRYALAARRIAHEIASMPPPEHNVRELVAVAARADVHLRTRSA
jgi:UDP:flavonoid glycosyltransferase YjiC (YdhE family)